MKLRQHLDLDHSRGKSSEKVLGVLTHIGAPDFRPTFLEAVLDVLALIPLMVPQTSNEVV